MEFRAKLERLLFTANKCPFQSPPLSSKRKGLNPLHGIYSCGTYPFLLSDTSTSINRLSHWSQSNEEMKEWNDRWMMKLMRLMALLPRYLQRNRTEQGKNKTATTTGFGEHKHQPIKGGRTQLFGWQEMTSEREDATWRFLSLITRDSTPIRNTVHDTQDAPDKL